jgi:hypothetical protein
MTFRRCAIAALVVVFFALSSLASADSVPLISVGGTPSVAFGIGNGFGPIGNQFVGVHFQLDQAVNNASVNAYLGGSHFQGTAWLTTAIGALASPQDVVASQGVDVNGTGSLTSIFQGLTLAPDDYYLLLSVPNDPHAGFGWWGFGLNTTVKTAGGATAMGDIFGNQSTCAGPHCLNFNFPPGSQFATLPGEGLLYQVSGDAAKIPEPLTGGLMLLGLLGLRFYQSRKTT